MAKTLEQWLSEGIDKGFCTPIYCDNHDGNAVEDSETLDAIWELSGGDHCNPVVRIKNEHLEDQLEYYREEEAAEKRRNLVEPVVDFI